MNRREFTRGLAALGVAPALPLPNLAKAAPVAASAAVASSAAVESMYFWGWFVARVHKTCSPEILGKMLKIEDTVAQEVFARLVNDGVVTAPNAAGISRAVDPLNDAFTTMKKSVAERVAERGGTVRKTHQKPSGQGRIDNRQDDDDERDLNSNADIATAGEDEPLPSVNQDDGGLDNELDPTTDSPDPDPDKSIRGG